MAGCGGPQREPPSTRSIDLASLPNGNTRLGEAAGPGIGGCLGQITFESAPVDGPPMTVGSVDEVVVINGISAPRRAVGVVREMTALFHVAGHPEFIQQWPGRRWDTLAHYVARVVTSLDYQGPYPGPGQT